MAIDAEAPPPPAEPVLPPRLYLVRGPAAAGEPEPGSATPSSTAPVDVLAELDRLFAEHGLDPAPPRRRSTTPRIFPRFSDGRRLALVLLTMLGLLTTLVGRGTVAYFTSAVAGQPNVFAGGIVDVSGSSLTTQSFGWTINGASNGSTSATFLTCTNVLGATSADIRTQAMAPGHLCVAPVDVTNTNLDSVDAWMRIRLYRATANGGTSATEALNDRLRFYMHEYVATSGASSAPTSTEIRTARDGDCTTSSYRPTWSNAAGVASATSAYGSSTGVIASQSVSSSPAVSRAALTSIADTGKNVGKHPGIGALNNVQLTDVVALHNAGLGLTSGGGGAPTETNMNTATNGDAYNLVGNDEVTNPVRTSGGANGTAPQGTLAEAQLLKNASRYYCLAMVFPSDTDIRYPDVYQNNAIFTGPVAQGTPFAYVANTTGDNSALSGSVTYYLVVSAAQKAGRTTP